MKVQLMIGGLVIAAASLCAGQVASHTPVSIPSGKLMESTPPTVQNTAVARVNGAVLTDRDLLREMYTIFPYARQHNGFPKGLEAQIRQGALQMIIFEELVYQEAQRRKMTIAPQRLNAAMRAYRAQFSGDEEYQQFLKEECHGSTQVMRQKIRRSLLIDQLLKIEIANKSAVTLVEARAYYDKNAQQFQRGETFSIQTISIIPPKNANAEAQKEAQRRAQDALKQAKAKKNYREFGLLAEKISDDDWHVNMGDRKTMATDQLPPPIVQAARKMKPGDVSDLLRFGQNYTLFRLNAYTPAGKVSFAETRKQILSDLQKSRTEQLRTRLNQRLQKNAKVEVL